MITALTNGRILTEHRLVEDHALLIEDGAILAIVPGTQLVSHHADIEVDVQGQYIAPGFIDIHSDMIEQIIQPRPNSMMDFEMALKEGEKQLLNQGITTMYHSLSLYKDDNFGVKEVRKIRYVRRLANLIARMHEKRHLIHHRFHARYEIDNIECLQDVRQLIDEGLVHEFSIMDHTPGQGQYRNLEVYRKQMAGYKGRQLSEDEWHLVLKKHREKDKQTVIDLKDLIDLAHAKGVPVSSHDDDTVEKVDMVHALGVSISEFPITIEAARRAKSLGMLTVAGAPNVLLGGSHSGNMSAAEAIMDGCVDILCSDYYPAAMLHSVFTMHEKHALPLHKAINLVTINAARAMKIDRIYGSIAPGKMADLLLIDQVDGYPMITQVMIHGRWTSCLAYRT